ncbi:MAG TPA: replicative DNA helicase [Candidatus Woesebacteria bacterium]|nr:replicative DNA helicase [Candidatus Woesebacteria bacterium]
MEPKIPPHDLEAEKSVLAAILIDKDAIIKVSEILKPESFYSKANSAIYEAMLELYDKRMAIYVITLKDQLTKDKKIRTVGGVSGISQLSNLLSTAANVENYAYLIKEKYVKRELIALSNEVGSLAFDESKEINEILDSAEQQVMAISQTHARRDFLPIKQTLVESFDRLDELQKSGGELRGLPTGFADLDRMLAGLQKSNLIILAARPGTGKTAFAVNIAQYVSVVAKKKVGIFSLEMSKEELVDRLLVGQADIDAWKLKTGRLSQDDFLKISDAMGVLAESKLFIDDTPGLSIYEMRTKARRLMMEQNIDLLIVDYLQLAHGQNRENRVQEVGEISQGLKNIARELKIPVLALAQLSRAVEQRGEKAPQLSDLRESGSIEQDADVVMFLYRKDDDLRESVTLKIAKHRNGGLGNIELYFRGDRVKFFGMENRKQ